MNKRPKYKLRPKDPGYNHPYIRYFGTKRCVYCGQSHGR